MPWKEKVTMRAKGAGVGVGAAVQNPAGVQVQEATLVVAQDMYLEVLRGLAVVLPAVLSLEVLLGLPLVRNLQK